MRIKLLSAFLSLIVLFGCASPNRGSIDNATVLNWENEAVTTEQFVRDHKACLGIDRPSYLPRSRIAKLISPNQSAIMPEWDGLWVTFQSNEYRDVGQRSLMSVPRNTASKSVGAYRRCMFRRGYLLRAM
ncbi:MAG: hypothetical protein IKA73_03260 [Alphaproteobacteria bacterium]|nr:hypothetical protein [Alphaproteobacteria bacterium]MBR2482948.1 hypothetical protein [Alphaproteobacteria bacterium]